MAKPRVPGDVQAVGPEALSSWEGAPEHRPPLSHSAEKLVLLAASRREAKAPGGKRGRGGRGTGAPSRGKAGGGFGEAGPEPQTGVAGGGGREAAVPTAAPSAARQPVLHVFKADPPSSPGGGTLLLSADQLHRVDFQPRNPTAEGCEPQRSPAPPIAALATRLGEEDHGGGGFSLPSFSKCVIEELTQN